jgi:hypothetical protein
VKPTIACASLARSAHRVVLAGLVLVAALPALLALCVGYSVEQQRAQASATATA